MSALLGAISFAFPWALAAFIVLPVVWWLLRFIPPRPKKIRFPALRFLLGLNSKEETPHKSPWWLTVLRTVIAALVILALADPILNPQQLLKGSSGPVAIVVDDGWAAAPRWDRRRMLLTDLVDEADVQDRPVLVTTTTPTPTTRTRELGFASPGEVAGRVAAITPAPLAPKRREIEAPLASALEGRGDTEIVWLSDGIDYGDAAAFMDRLAGMAGAGDLSVFLDAPGEAALVMLPPKPSDRGLTVEIARPAPVGPQQGTLRALALNGRLLGETSFEIEPDQLRTEASIALPLALRNQLARLEIAESRSPAAVYLLDDRWRRKPVGLVSGTASERAQPLLSPLYYVERALAPYSELHDASKATDGNGIGGLIDAGLSTLVLADIGQLVDRDREQVADWVEAGGVLVRFAGPRLARANDSLIPVKLRRGGRALGGALSWSKPQTLSPFPDDSPFSGLDVPGDVTVERQVLAEPDAELESKVWARLSDGTPLVTGAPRGNGMIVLFHVPASPQWSNLPLSGLFVEMLRQIVDMSLGVAATGTARPGQQAAQLESLPPLRTLDGFARLGDPPGDARPIAAGDFEETALSPRHPPGLYGSEARFRALNVTSEQFSIQPLPELPSQFAIEPYVSEEATALKGPLLVGAFALLILDGLAVLMLAGWLRVQRRRVAQTAAIVLMAVGASLTPASAQSTPDEPLSPELRLALRATQETHLAYVVTGNDTIDTASRAGLRGLNEVLISRTAFEPGVPIGVDLENDELAFFPLIYWPVTAEARVPSDKTLAKIDSFMKSGGTVLFDTRDNQQAIDGAGTGLVTPETEALRRILGKLDIPPLEMVPADHVLTKAFYLLQGFPGRWAGGQLWVEAEPAETEETIDQRNPRNPDGVSAIIIGANDYAAAWATDPGGSYMFPVVPGGPRQRELAYRTGVNIVMYALTGNYKADQVHVPALLERLGQ